jgi:predicted Zn-dependent protease
MLALEGLSMRRTLLLAIVMSWLPGCATLDQALYETSAAVAPPHPVYGTPVFNVVPEAQEVAQAQQTWTQLDSAARQHGIAVDPPGERLARIRTVFLQLVAVAHRQQLRWEAHLLAVPEVNAFTFGGGVVVVFDGLFGEMVAPHDDDELAGVLAHEIAHVTLLHVPTRQTWTAFGSLAVKATEDNYYRAAYTTEQEAEADRIAALYMALAGFDPMAAPRVWARAHQRYGSSAGRAAFIHDHPLNADRMAATSQAASLVVQYREPGQQNPEWETILASNVLYIRAEEAEYTPGVGLGRAAAATLDTWAKHERVLSEQERREGMAKALQAIRVVRVGQQPTPDGRQAIVLDVYNGTNAPITGLAIDVQYLSRQQLAATDSDCRQAVNIPPGQTVRVGCYLRQVPGATGVQPQIVDARWQ